MKTLKVALIGAGGNMRNAHLPRIEADGSVEIVAVADPVEDQAELLIDKAGRDIPHYADWRTMLDDTPADAVLISTPHRDHFEQARVCLEHDLHVLVEKPMVILPHHAEQLLELAAERGRVLEVAYQRHWMPAFVYARELVASGALGQIRGVVAYVTQDWRGAGGWRLDPALSGGGMFMDTGSHLVAALLWVTGLAPKRVSASFDNAGLAVDVNASLTVDFDGGAVGTLATIGNAQVHDEQLAIIGSEGTLALHLHRWTVRSVRHDDEPVTVPDRIAPQTPDGAFFDAIRSGGTDWTPPRFALQVARLTDAAYRSSASDSRPVPT